MSSALPLLRALLDAVTADQVSVPRAWLVSLVNEGAAARGGDADVDEVAARFNVGRSTVRTWAKQGRLPGSYKLAGHEWRFPPAAIEALAAVHRGEHAEAGLGAWRHVAGPDAHDPSSA